MKPADEKLQRLLQAAAKAAPESLQAPLGLETRVLAQWRASSTDGDALSVFLFLRRAAIGAGLVLALCAAWSLSHTSRSIAGEEAAQLDYNIEMSLNP